MMNHLRITPVLCAAAGTAAGFYFLAFLNPIVSIVFLALALAALCFFRVLVSFCRQIAGLDGRFKLCRRLQLTAVCTAAFAAALMLGLCAASAGRREAFFSLPPENITAIEGVLLEDPRIISGGRAFVSLSLKRCGAAGSVTAGSVTAGSAAGAGVRATARGEITVFFPQESAERLREFGRGTAVFAEGRLRSAAADSPAMAGGWTFSADSLHITEPAPAIERMRTGIRLNLISRFDGKDWGGLALALLLGIRDNLDSSLAASYRKAGCSYILALSGMHLAVLAAIIAFLLKKPLGLKAASITGAAIICLYCFIVGPMPSLNRAALMYILGVVAILGALPKEPLSILSLSFLIQIVFTPAAGHSLSFVLSYLALGGILIIGRPLYLLFAGKVPDFLMQPLSASCGAFLATAGVTGFSFGVIYPAGIIAGLVLVPLTTLFMIGSLVWLLLDLLSISSILSLPLSLLFRLMEGIVSAAGKVPGISAGKPAIVLVLSLVLSLLIVVFEYRQRAARLRMEPFL